MAGGRKLVFLELFLAGRVYRIGRRCRRMGMISRNVEFFMMKNVRLALMLAGLAGLTVGSQAAAAKLKVGDPAPKLQVAKWVQGEPVKEFAKDKAYIVEFWA